MKKVLLSIWNNLERVLMVFLLGGFLINVFLQVIFRTVNHPVPWTEEVSRYLFAWMIFLGLSYATKYNKHIRATFVVDKFPATVKFIIEFIIGLLTLAVFAWVLVVGIQYLFYVKSSITYALGISKSVVAAIIPFSACLMLLRQTEKLVKDTAVFIKERKAKGGKQA